MDRLGILKGAIVIYGKDKQIDMMIEKTLKENQK